MYKKLLMYLLVGEWLMGWAFFPFTPAVAQQPVTTTPDATGAVYVVVQPNDNLWNIAVAAGITLEQLRALNNLSESDFIQPGQHLLVGYNTPPATSTSPATATRLPPTVTFTPLPPPRTAVCLLAFVDDNQNGVYDQGEGLQTAVAFTLFTAQTVVTNYITNGSEPYCLEGLTAGAYQITRSVGRNESLTTDGDMTISLAVGDVVRLEFGSYPGEAVTVTETAVPLTPTLLPIAAATMTATPAPLPPAQPAFPTTTALLLLVVCGLTAVSVLFFSTRKRRM